MPADEDFNTALKLDLLATTEPPVGLTDLRDVGWTGKYDVIDTVEQVRIDGIPDLQSLPYREQYVSQPFEGRPDLIADSVYGNATLAWILKVVNGLLLNSDFKKSIKIRVPNKEDVETLFLLSGGQNET